MSELNAWNINPDPHTFAYHVRQYDEPYRSTVHFAEFVADKMKDAKFVIDAGCGAGAPTSYLAARYPETQFVGLDVSEELVMTARDAPNLDYEVDDLTNLHVRFNVDGVTLIQVLSWMQNYEVALHQVATRIRPKWIAFSTLVYDGAIDARIVVHEPRRPRVSYYNVYSLDAMREFMQREKYAFADYRPFNIDIDMPKPNDADIMQTWTDHGLQRSGPLLLPWGFCMFERIGAG